MFVFVSVSEILGARESRNLIYRPALDQMNDLLAYLTAHCCHGTACEVTAAPGCTTC